MDDVDPVPLIRTLTLPADANLSGGIFGGWILAQLDKAAGLFGMQRSKGPCATVAIQDLRFVAPLTVGDDFAIYGRELSIGRTSMRLRLEGHARSHVAGTSRLVVEGTFVSVALDDAGRPRVVVDGAGAVEDVSP